MPGLGRLLHRLAAALPPGVVSWLGRIQFQHPWLARALERVSAPMRQTDVPIVRGPAAGLRISAGPNPGYAMGTTEPEVQEALTLHLRAGDVFYDVGAGVGFFTLIAARLVGPTGRVVAIEPNPLTATVLRHNVGLNNLTNVDVVEGAVLADGGHAVITLAGTASKLATDGSDAENGTTVRVVSIDQLVEELGGRPPAVVKLDIEGAEDQALQGMLATIAATHPVILCETHGTVVTVRERLETVGYRTQLLDPEIAGHVSWNVHLLAVPDRDPGSPKSVVR